MISDFLGAAELPLKDTMLDGISSKFTLDLTKEKSHGTHGTLHVIIDGFNCGNAPEEETVAQVQKLPRSTDHFVEGQSDDEAEAD